MILVIVQKWASNTSAHFSYAFGCRLEIFISDGLLASVATPPGARSAYARGAKAHARYAPLQRL